MRPTLPYLVSCWIKFHNVLYFLIDFFSILTFLLSFSNLFCEMTNSIHHPQNSAVLPSISFKQLLITITYLSKNVELVVILESSRAHIFIIYLFHCYLHYNMSALDTIYTSYHCMHTIMLRARPQSVSLDLSFSLSSFSFFSFPFSPFSNLF